MKRMLYISAILIALFTTCEMPKSDWNPNGQASVLIKITAGGVQERTVMPDVALQDVTTWQLWGGKQEDPETLLGEFASGGTMELTIDLGIWHFTLKGFKEADLILAGSIAKQSIGEGENILDFTVAPVLEGQGTFNNVSSMKN